MEMIETRGTARNDPPQRGSVLNMDEKQAKLLELMHRAPWVGSAKPVKEYLDVYGGVDAKGVYGHTLLILASIFGNIEAMEHLLSRSAALDIKNDDGNTALILAARLGHAEAVHLLLVHGAQVDIKGEKETTALKEAALAGHTDIVKMLLVHGADVNLKDENGDSLLVLAARAGHGAVVDVLRQAPHIQPEVRDDPEVDRRLQGWRDVRKLAFAAAATPQSAGVLQEPLLELRTFAAAEEGDTEELEALLDEGADVNEKGPYGSTLLILAARYGHIETVRMLLIEGADVNAQNKAFDTALIAAAWNGHTEIVQLLLQAGALVNVKGENDYTAPEVAARNGHSKTLDALLQAPGLTPEVLDAVERGRERFRRMTKKWSAELDGIGSKILSDKSGEGDAAGAGSDIAPPIVVRSEKGGDSEGEAGDVSPPVIVTTTGKGGDGGEEGKGGAIGTPVMISVPSSVVLPVSSSGSGRV